MKCSSVCRHCSGTSCDNVPDVAPEIDFDSPEGDDLSDVDVIEDVLWAQDIEETSPSPDRDPHTEEPLPCPFKRAKFT